MALHEQLRFHFILLSDLLFLFLTFSYLFLPFKLCGLF